MSLKRIWLAGFVRLWHTNPDLAHFIDPQALPTPEDKE